MDRRDSTAATVIGTQGTVFRQPKDSLQDLPAGESVEATFDIAKLYDLNETGDYDIDLSGFLAYTTDGGKTLAGSIPYELAPIHTYIDGVEAAKILAAQIAKRTTIDSTCSSSQTAILKQAGSRCLTLANAATSGITAARMNKFFKVSDAASMNSIRRLYQGVKTECNFATGGFTAKCGSPLASVCKGTIYATTYGSQKYIVFCHRYFSSAVPQAASCRSLDKGMSLLHETTHLPRVRGTGDHGYGYSACIGLSSNLALDNADCYAWFAQDTLLGGC
ncbi:hypothetical protein VHEMI09418 [[Torrubiella] hemipterigena]|uniref:Neutral protease 2 n=1 Tax=[Torrubiella] hemipterigena TaxID=1531966 RepID=A0A0A1TRG1_9HYPO|nr:hypothetical protein VHEMI09418 [[Torrubiella] hemipterigena]